MEKAFDVKDLMMKLDKAGVPVLEDMAQVVVAQVLDWVQESVMMSETKMDDIALAFIPMVKAMLAPVVDQLDGKLGE